MNRLLCATILVIAANVAAAEPATQTLIPQPVSVEPRDGAFRFAPDTRVAAAGPAREEAEKLVEALAPAMGFRLRIADGNDGPVRLALDASLEKQVGDEGYILDVTPKRIGLRAAAPAGLFYGIQTIRQLLPKQVFGKTKVAGVTWSLPCVKITDAPRFGWRGLLVDPARHFIPKADMLRYLDAMAMHKLNRLQIHLTDNEGWRIEIKKYPKLTTVGSTRDRSGTGPGHGGFYSQADMREIVKYAADRHITIIPEIEMPAHTGAASLAYPDELALKPKRHGHVLAPRPAAVTFMQNVLTEIMEIFPSKHIHIGGDEANTGVWQKNEEMQDQMRRMGHANVHELHSWFIKQMDAFLTRHGRRLVGWDEILQGGLAEGATVMSWRGTRGGIAAAKAGHDVVMAPTSHTYFDYRQAPKELGLGRSVINVEKVYAFEPIPAELSDKEARHVLGGQGQLWGELIKDRERREFMTWPRACALAEVLWTPVGRRDLSGFLSRLIDHRPRLKAAGVNFRPLDDAVFEQAIVRPFDYFENNWNVVGLKDYVHGARLTPDNMLVLSGRVPVQIRVGRSLMPLSRAHGKTARHGWLPIFRVDAADGPVLYETTFWATPLPDAKDWKKAFDWPTEGENFLTWIQVRAVNRSDRPAEAVVELGPDARIKVPKCPEMEKEPKTEGTHTRKHAWTWQLPPGGSEIGIARYPYFPVKDPKAYDGEDAGLWLERTEAWWRNEMKGITKIRVPCQKANEALLAAHVCQLIASDHGEVHGGEDFYDIFYPRDGAYQVMELEEAGLFDAAAKALEHYLACQGPDGRFRGGGNQGPQLDANGQTLWTFWQYYKITGDRAWIERVYPRMLRAARWTVEDRKKAPADSPVAGLVHAALADGECLWGGKNHIVGYDLWNLRGMLCTADAARILGRTDDAEELLADAKSYRAAIDAAWKKTGLPHFPPSWEKAGTHWGNTETLWPTELFAHDDPRIAASSRHVREEFAGGYIEGTIQWKGRGKTEAIHPYMGAYTTMNDLIRGEHEKVVEDFYWTLLHTSAANAFPEGIYYKQRTAWNNTIPHVTGACNYAILLRHMLVHEAGDELHLLSAVPDGWLDEGREIRIEGAPTHFGRMSLVVRGTAEGVRVDLTPPKREPPKRTVIHLPPNRLPVGQIDGVEVARRTNQTKRWDFPAVIDAYLKLNPKEIAAPPSRPAKLDAVSLTTGKPSTCSHALPPHPARLANDGHRGDTDKYWATDVGQHPGPAWWQVDLQKPTTVGRVVVVGYYGDNRHYGFTVEASLDGKKWETVADMRDNKAPSTVKGHTCRFKPRPVRFLRVTQTHNSANTGRHLVEVMAYEK